MRCHLKRVVTYFLLLLAAALFLITIPDLQGHQHHDHDGSVNVLRPPANKNLHIWTTGFNETDDRIPAQMVYIPKSVKAHPNDSKVIYVATGMGKLPRGKWKFVGDKCPVQNCLLTDDSNEGPVADGVLFQNYMSRVRWMKPQHQIWILFLLESPDHTSFFDASRNLINWTATYRRDSTLVTPYERWTPDTAYQEKPGQTLTNYALNKTRQVAWFVSNCNTYNGRMEYVQELQKYISVDIYGACSELSCPRHDKARCFKMLKDSYKFYLAFENSNCKDYITEKLYWNAFQNDVIPVVMGARPIDYQLSCPPHSYIHVDDFESPKELADYLHQLDKDDQMYNEYFRWKGTGSFIDTKFWCRLCAMMHDTSRNSWFSNVSEWWRGGNTCIRREGQLPWATWRGVNTTHSSVQPLHYAPYNVSKKEIHIDETNSLLKKFEKQKRIAQFQKLKSRTQWSNKIVRNFIPVPTSPPRS